MGPGANVKKLFTVVSYDFHHKLEHYDPGKLLQPSLIFAGKAGAYPSEPPFSCSTLGLALYFTNKYLTRLQKLPRDKHSNLL